MAGKCICCQSLIGQPHSDDCQLNLTKGPDTPLYIIPSLVQYSDTVLHSRAKRYRRVEKKYRRVPCKRHHGDTKFGFIVGVASGVTICAVILWLIKVLVIK